ncbi:UNKNOWN [Stylonychia lemnae]|uniref:Transmembrane protein n=1 Tax=Stylonychia lemnae TaxID=5949 RepID=A0A077ZZP7_STYLE|nr:UNKNOWN [Stylonychia lemnae]|eukprot:CDW75406.1 UNKNOWN [Stylonychia lemnae]
MDDLDIELQYHQRTQFRKTILSLSILVDFTQILLKLGIFQVLTNLVDLNQLIGGYNLQIYTDSGYLVLRQFQHINLENYKRLPKQSNFKYFDIFEKKILHQSGQYDYDAQLIPHILVKYLEEKDHFDVRVYELLEDVNQVYKNDLLMGDNLILYVGISYVEQVVFRESGIILHQQDPRLQFGMITDPTEAFNIITNMPEQQPNIIMLRKQRRLQYLVATNIYKLDFQKLQNFALRYAYPYLLELNDQNENIILADMEIIKFILLLKEEDKEQDFFNEFENFAVELNGVFQYAYYDPFNSDNQIYNQRFKVDIDQNDYQPMILIIEDYPSQNQQYYGKYEIFYFKDNVGLMNEDDYKEILKTYPTFESQVIYIDPEFDYDELSFLQKIQFYFENHNYQSLKAKFYDNNKIKHVRRCLFCFCLKTFKILTILLTLIGLLQEGYKRYFRKQKQ